MTSVAQSSPTTDDRQRALVAEVSRYAARGWEVVSQTPTQAQLAKGKPTSHLLHFFLSLFTLGLWLPVWACVALFAGRKTKLLTVDDSGRVRAT